MIAGNIAAGAITLAVSGLFLLSALIVVWWLDRHEGGPLRWVGGAVLCGAIAAGVAALVLSRLPEDIVRAAVAQPIGALVLPAGEELLKALFLGLVLVLMVRFDSPTDGLVYGTAAGLGFVVARLVVRAVADSSVAGGALAAAAGSSGLDPAVHGVTSATFSVMLGTARLANGIARRLAWIGVGLVLAIGLRGAWGGALAFYPSTAETGVWLPSILMLALMCAAFAVLVVASVLREGLILRTQLREEVSLGVLPAWVVEVIPSYRRRIRSAWWSRRQERAVISRLLIRLAFRKQALRGLPATEVGIAGLEVVQLRHRLRRILDLQAAGSE